jgi:hypothetical protein
MDGSRYVYMTSARVTSLNTITCYLSQDTLQLFSVNANFSVASEEQQRLQFLSLPPGGAVLKYTVAISNDGKQFGDERTLRIVDTLCMECRDEQEYTQKVGWRSAPPPPYPTAPNHW